MPYPKTKHPKIIHSKEDAGKRRKSFMLRLVGPDGEILAQSLVESRKYKYKRTRKKRNAMCKKYFTPAKIKK